MLLLKKLHAEMVSLHNPSKAKLLSGFFKTGVGEYGEGDLFLGITVPQTRSVAKKYWVDASLADIEELLASEWHEERLCALLILVEKYKKAKVLADKKELVDFYLAHTKNINNWDLVDLSAHAIVGEYFAETNQTKDNPLLTKLVHSPILWERRIAVLTSFAFIKRKDFYENLRLAKLLLTDKHDLMHKAVGWMLREIGKRDERVLRDFLAKNYASMPRTALRYAIERLPEKERKGWLLK